MSYYLDMKYINLMGPRLEKFAWKKNNLATCRCPVCGDSKKNKNKTRFFFYEQKGKFFVKCHNCAYSTTFARFLEKTGGMLYEDYTLESLKDKFQGSTAATEYRAIEKKFSAIDAPVFDVAPELQHATRISELSNDHHAKQYICKRMIPEKHWSILYYCENFNAVANLVEPGRYPQDKRIVIPFYDRNKKMFAIQGRALDSSAELRYITVRDSNQDIPKIYGLDRLDDKRKNYCFEGPIDSLFVDNSVALAGSSIDLKSLPFDSSQTVFVYDNEPRNTEIVKTLQRVADQGYRVCVWPSTVTQKDANDMRRAGIENVQRLIDGNTYQGLAAKLAISNWKKI